MAHGGAGLPEAVRVTPPLQRRPVALKFQLSDKTLFTKVLTLKTHEIGLSDGIAPVAVPEPPAEPLEPDCAGFLIRSFPVTGAQPVLRTVDGYWCYVPSQYRRYFINLGQSFEDYSSKFSSKTRSTIRRKIKKFDKHVGGDWRWRRYQEPDEMDAFFDLARAVSARTYQEKLLDAGLPEGEAFRQKMLQQAKANAVRGYLLFVGEKPVAYLYCPARDGVLIYAYLGYDPDYMKWSVGTILHWHALEDILAEGRFKLFDFTEGESDHKRLFASDSIECANVYFLRKSLGHLVLIGSHAFVNGFSRWLGDVLDRFGAKARIKKLLRFGR